MLGVKLPGDALYGHYTEQRTRQSVLLHTLPLALLLQAWFSKELIPRQVNKKLHEAKSVLGKHSINIFSANVYNYWGCVPCGQTFQGS